MEKVSNFRRIINQTILVNIIAVLILICSGCHTESISQVVHLSDNKLIVNISAKSATKENPVKVELNEGNYQIKVIGISEGGAFDAWYAWYLKKKKDDNGVWIRGWLNNYSYSATGLDEVTCKDGKMYETPDEALKNATNNKFSLKSKSILNFYIIDSPHFDNRGGISLSIVRETDSL